MGRGKGGDPDANGVRRVEKNSHQKELRRLLHRGGHTGKGRGEVVGGGGDFFREAWTITCETQLRRRASKVRNLNEAWGGGDKYWSRPAGGKGHAVH